MTLSEYLSDHLGPLILNLAGMTALIVFLLATGTDSGVVVIIVLTWLIGFFSAHTVSFLKQRSHIGELRTIMDALDEKYLFTECAPKPVNAYERCLYNLMRIAGRSMTGAVSDARASQQDYREYVENWVHEIKTPITAAQLICRSAEPAIRRRMLPELSQIEDHVERALFYARSENPEQDLVIRRANLSDILDQALSRHRVLLIQSGVRVVTEEPDYTVYTDEKWAAFVVGQLLQNAVRYRGENPEIRLSARMLGRQVQLSVEDNGIGIPSHDLPRIFDRGFTGSNGRSRGGSTGMGLYICRRLACFLQIDLAVNSSESRGSSFTLTFPSRESFQNCKIK